MARETGLLGSRIRPGPLSFLLAGTVAIRAVPLLIWFDLPLMRDELSYAELAQALLEGRGIVPTAHGWLWAPLYPVFLAVHRLLFGSILSARITQVLLSALAAFLVYRLGWRLGGVRVALFAGWLYALEPTLIAFSHYFWTEHLYSVWLLLALESALTMRDRHPGLSALPGLAMGLAMLTRGVGTYALPFLALAPLWGRWRDARAWLRAGSLAAAAVLTVVPYAVHASRAHGGLVLVDTSVGFNMWLGNNTFEPVSFDYQMGGDLLAEEDYARLGGRPECWSGLPVAEKNACEIANGLAFIRDRPLLFLRRAGTRLAQTFNPSSFLLRNLRMGRYEGMPRPVREGLCMAVLLFHFLIVGTAAVGAGASWGARVSGPAARASGACPDVAAGSLAGARTGEAAGQAQQAAIWALTFYHLAAAGALIGLSRFRVPLLPLWIPFSAIVLADPSDALRRFLSGPWRTLVTAAVLSGVLLSSLVYIGRAFPR